MSLIQQAPRAPIDFEAVRAANPLSSVAAATVKLSRAGHEWKGCCPFHPDRSPSFTIFAGDRRFQCFGCGANGDVVDFVARLHGVGLRDALGMLDSGTLSRVERTVLQPVRGSEEADFGDAARRIWQGAAEMREESPAYRYLVSRNLGGPVPPALRFARLRCKLLDGDRGPRHPALVALVVDVDGNPVGVQRTFLTEDGAKAFGRDSKLSLGRVKGGAIRLAPALGDVCVTEGMEDALSLQRMSGIPAWAAGGSSMLPSMILPDGLNTVTIGADADAAGIATAQEAAQAFARQGRLARIIYPAEGHKDFNAELMAEAER